MSRLYSGLPDSVFAGDLAACFRTETTADKLSDEADVYFASDSSSDDATENEEDLLLAKDSDDATL